MLSAASVMEAITLDIPERWYWMILASQRSLRVLVSDKVQ